MIVGIGCSDNPESSAAGLQVANMALSKAGRADPCDMVLLFSTARHDFEVLREAVASATGSTVPIYGGGAIGVITNEYFGYAGDQVAAACIWLDGVDCKVLVEDGLNTNEEETGKRLGQRLAESGTNTESPVMLFYDTFDFTEGMKMMMATWLLAGIEDGLGFIPNLAGAGLMGNHSPASTKMWTGDSLGEHNALAISFSGDIRMDVTIMHGCHPATGYYTVTKAVGQAILEINGKPAIQFIDELLDSSIAPEQYPFFLIFGINHGDPWGAYDEDYYASRLCLSVDKESGAIIMFEPDMVEGTEFQLMFRSMELSYIKPKIDKLFEDIEDREPVLAMYINCAGRCAGYAGSDIEDAPIIQDTIAGRVPLLGLYAGVEIASIGGRPRGLDWTGVFCLFSQSKGGSGNAGKKAPGKPVWDGSSSHPSVTEASAETLAHLCEQNAARYLALDASSIAIRYELEQKRRGFALLSELSSSLRHSTSNANLFTTTTKRINSALNMQRTVVLVHDGKGRFSFEVLQGYSAEEKARLAGQRIRVPIELLYPDNPAIVTGADPVTRFKELRKLLGLPYFVSSPVILQGVVYAILLTGRTTESVPYLTRLSRSDAETVQAISALLASVLFEQLLAVTEERTKIMIDASPICCMFWDEKDNLTDCNKEALSLFGSSSKIDFIKRFHRLSPEFQPDGFHSKKTFTEYVKKAFVTGEAKFEWTFVTYDRKPLPTEVTLIRIPRGENYSVVGYIRDLREQEAVKAKMEEAQELAERHIKAKNEFLASVSHEIRTPMNAIQAMANTAAEIIGSNDSQRSIIQHGLQSVQLLTSAIETILDFSKLDSGQLSLEYKEFNLASLMDGIVGMVRAEADSKSLSLGMTIDSNLPAVLLGDPARLSQAIFNIVINAVKFTEEGGIDIRVYRDGDDMDDKASVAFEVRDSGIGIDDDQIESLFKPLQTGDSSYTRKYGGLGMGLAISSGLVALMGGSIDCMRPPEGGSTFNIRLPLAMPKKKAIETEIASTVYDPDILRGLRVLVAEDNNINQMIVEELLTSIGVKVTLADNGLQALERLRENEFDIILMDVQMPEMDGLTTTIQIRSDQRYDNLPIIAMTANVGAEHVEESRNAGMNDHLSKPVDMDLLYNALIKWSGRDRA